MPIDTPGRDPQPSFVTCTWTLYLTSTQLSKLTEYVSLTEVGLRVRPSGLADQPHAVKLTIRAEPADFIRINAKLDEDLQRQRLG